MVAALVALLWLLRPGLPQLPESASEPMTTGQLEEVIVFLGWLALLVVLLLGSARDRAGASATPASESRRVTARVARRPARAPIESAAAFRVAAPAKADRPSDAALGPARATEDPARTRDDAAAPRPALRIRLLGPFSIDGVRGNMRAVRSSTEQLIAYLALRPRGAARDELVEAIWPGEDPQRTRQRLWQSTSEARKLIGEALVSRRGHYSLDRTKLAVDADELEALLADVNATVVHGGQRRTLERGVGLLRGEPLAGWDHIWADTEAARLRAAQAELLERLGQARLASGDAHGALQAVELALHRDALNEGLWRLAMQAEVQLGLREAVSRRYERLRTLLAQQLGLEPESGTRALYRELLGQR
jgi:SARP family transcriptional regulator, regulator of embCAB operon